MGKLNKADNRQEGGNHYKDMAITPWEIMQSNFTQEEFEGFLKGSALKRIMRSRVKDGKLDIKKAKHELEKLIEIME